MRIQNILETDEHQPPKAENSERAMDKPYVSAKDAKGIEKSAEKVLPRPRGSNENAENGPRRVMGPQRS